MIKQKRDDGIAASLTRDIESYCSKLKLNQKNQKMNP
jgi:hypothetical protein